MTRYSIDTRTLQPGEHYVAIKGERFDGNTFAADALAKGAGGLVLSEPPNGLQVPDGVALTLVDDGEAFLGEQARQRLQAWGIDVIGITGSMGKTTTKGAIATALEESFDVVASEGNLNTVLGLALTVLNRLTTPEQKLIAEMGAYGRGSIARLCSYYQPTISVVTVVRPVHLERMGSIDNIRLAKQEIVEALPETGTACLNWDDARVRSMADACKGEVLSYGEHPEAAIRPDRITAEIPLLGSYVTQTALAAYSVGHSLGMSSEAINRGLARLRAERGRLRKLPGRGGSTLVDDTYNAAQASTRAALDALHSQPATRRIAFLGDMLELGDEETEAHRDVVAYAAERVQPDLLVLVGERMQRAARETDVAGRPEVALFDTSNDAIAAMQDGLYTPAQGDVVLAKGSASVRMERIMEALLDPSVDPADVLVRQSPGWKQQ